MITDGGDRNSELSDEEALRKISGTKTIVNAIVLGDSHARFLDRAASNTGGSVVSATKDIVARELRDVLADINSRYLARLPEPAARSAAGGRIDVTPRARRRGDRRARAKGYFAE